MSESEKQKYRMSSVLYTETIFQTLAFIGICIKLLFQASPTADGSQGPASTTIWAYGLILMSILGLITTKFAFYQNETKTKKINVENDPAKKDDSALSSLLGGTFKGLISSIPTIGIAISLIWLIYLNYIYYTPINQGHVSSEYNNFSIGSTLMILLQLFILAKELYELRNQQITEGKKKSESETRQKQDELFSYLLGLLSLIFVLMQNIVLVYFTTDG